MTLASTHPMLEVSIDFYDHSSPNSLWKIYVHIQLVVLAKPKLHSMPRSNWNLEVFVGLGFSCVSIYKLQPLYFVTDNFLESLQCEGWKLCIAHFCEVRTKKKPPQKAFDRCGRLEYGTLTSRAFGALCFHPPPGKWDFTESRKLLEQSGRAMEWRPNARRNPGGQS